VDVVVGGLGSISVPVVYGPALQGSDFVVRFVGTPGFAYRIESAPDVTGPWTRDTEVTAPTTDGGLGVGVFEFRQTMGADATRFFRVAFPAP
jgi:hypothetical protein